MDREPLGLDRAEALRAEWACVDHQLLLTQFDTGNHRRADRSSSRVWQSTIGIGHLAAIKRLAQPGAQGPRAIRRWPHEGCLLLLGAIRRRLSGQRASEPDNLVVQFLPQRIPIPPALKRCASATDELQRDGHGHPHAVAGNEGSEHLLHRPAAVEDHVCRDGVHLRKRLAGSEPRNLEEHKRQIDRSRLLGAQRRPWRELGEPNREMLVEQVPGDLQRLTAASAWQRILQLGGELDAVSLLLKALDWFRCERDAGRQHLGHRYAVQQAARGFARLLEHAEGVAGFRFQQARQRCSLEKLLRFLRASRHLA